MARCKDYDNGNSDYTSLTAIPVPDMSFGTCQCCGQANQVLANGRCEDCRFYSLPTPSPHKRRRAANTPWSLPHREPLQQVPPQQALPPRGSATTRTPKKEGHHVPVTSS